MRNAFHLGKSRIYSGCRPVFLPDIGTFFNQDIDLALELIVKLKESGVSVIKGELLHSPDICFANSGNEIFWDENSRVMREEHYKSLIERKIVSLEEYGRIFNFCSSIGLDFVLSVYDFEGAYFAKNIGASGIKIASSNITHQPLIETVTKLDLPVIFDSGHSTIEEVARAVNWFRDSGGTKLVVQHSPLPPPNPPESQNLKFMQTLGTCANAPYGLSDHCVDNDMLYAGVFLGAAVVEKGVKPDDLVGEQDSAHAMPVSSVEHVVSKINSCFDALGTGERHLRRDRVKYRSRMSLSAKVDLVPGDIVDLQNVGFAFPALGIPVEEWEKVVNKKICTTLGKGSPLRYSDVCD